MNQNTFRHWGMVGAAAATLLSSCTTQSSDEQWKNDDTGIQEQLKGYPDRESSDQEKRDAEAARRAKLLTK